MRTNKKNSTFSTHAGGAATIALTPIQELRRTVLSCLLFEDTFYENGVEISERIRNLVKKVDIDDLKNLIIETRVTHNLRHVPLLLITEALKLRNPELKLKEVIFQVINRPDELTELISLWWQDGKKPLPSQLKKGLAKAFHKFDEYQFSKYNKKKDLIKIRDVMFLCHPKPQKEAERLFAKIANNELQPPDTWEVNLSQGKDKKETWERLIRENKLGSLAFIRNLRNMIYVGVDYSLIRKGLMKLNVSKLFPYQFISAARNAEIFMSELEELMFKTIRALNYKDDLETAILVDISGSMFCPVSRNSDALGADLACSIAIIGRELFSNVHIYSFSNDLSPIPDGRGFALADAIINSQPHGDTNLGKSIKRLISERPSLKRLIVITDEQSTDIVPSNIIPCRGYLINIAPYRYGVGYGGNWIHIDGFSEAVIKFLIEYEKEFLIM